jgi:hypothetical protein
VTLLAALVGGCYSFIVLIDSPGVTVKNAENAGLILIDKKTDKNSQK